MTLCSLNNLELTPGALAQLACVLEATARKPGNVHRFRDFDDATYLDFILSAAAIARPLDNARTLGVGAAVFAAVESTQRLIATNTNLGMVLLFGPLAAVDPDESLADGVASVLESLTIDDAIHAYRAIRLARPGGLGAATDQDVARAPTVTLLDAMRLAADRDVVARQYATSYHDLFHFALPLLVDEFDRGGALESAIVACALGVQAEIPDTLIARKRGVDLAREASARARAVFNLHRSDDPGAAQALAEFDRWLRDEGRARNPGATADLVAAALFAALREGLIQPPFRFEPPSDHAGLCHLDALRDDNH
ncbi:MAG: triphosphoribosyl-dephospho-CoA synthase [Planctomycetota bacterium]|nr:triphosphoribosyl-dephospho-CoA synthase [Planctomycetota bacterium]